MGRKGFTLIELLAVIVILAIIALIATPIVLSIINNSKTSSSEKNVEMYLNAVELSLANNLMKDSGKSGINGQYQIIDEGKKIKNMETGYVIPVEYKGGGLESGVIDIKNGTIKRIKSAKTGNSYAAIVDNKIKLFNTLPESELISGDKFSVAIKSLVSGETKKYDDSDSLIKSVEFLSYGKLPNNYSYMDLQKMESTDVSLNKDNSILAYHDGEGNVFIYSKNLIFFHSYSGAMFYRMQGIKQVKFNTVDTSNVTSFASAFENCNNLEIVDLTALDTSKVTSMTWMFYGCNLLSEIDLSSFDTSNVTNMSNMFLGCKNLTEINVNYFDTSKVTTMAGMFSECSSLTNIDVSGFNTKNVKNMGSMFRGCSNLKFIDVSNFDTTSLTYIGGMFNICTNLEEIKLGNFNIENVTGMEYMFYGCTNLKKLNLVSFDTANITNMSYMFAACKNLTEIVVSNKWVIKDSANTNNMFTNCGTDKVTLN